MLKKLVKDCAGTAAIEYALIVTLAAIGIVVGFANIGRASAEPLAQVADCLENSPCPDRKTGGGASGGKPGNAQPDPVGPTVRS